MILHKYTRGEYQIQECQVDIFDLVGKGVLKFCWRRQTSNESKRRDIPVQFGMTGLLDVT